MSKSSMTVRDVFELPEPRADKPADWKSFEERVTKEVKGIKTAALADMAEKVAELFEIPIPDILLSSWKKADGIKALLDESRKSPETVMNTELGEHTINSQHHPHIEVRIQNKAVKKLEFTLKLVFNLKGFVLKIQDGAIRGMQTGLCDIKGKLEYQGLVIAEKKLAPITLPGTISFYLATHDLGKPTVEPVKTVEAKPAEAIPNPAPSVGKPAIADMRAADAALSAVKAIDEEVEGIRAEPVPYQYLKSEPASARASSEAAKAERENRIGEEINGAHVAGPRDVQPRESATIQTSTATIHPNASDAAPQVTANEGVAPPKTSEGSLPETQEASSVVEDDERMVWEVGDEEEEGPVPYNAGGNSNGANAASESPQEAIDRMSRELTDHRSTRT